MRASIIIAARNRANLLHSALTSICDHQYKDTEVIVVDDASSDNTAEVISQFTGIRYLRMDRPGGYRKNPGPVYNIAHSIAEGEVHIEQSAETVHLTPAVDLLVDACKPGTMALATVYKGSMAQLLHMRELLANGEYEYGEPFVETAPIVVGHHRQPRRQPGHGAYMICGVERPCPFMFLGAIHSEDWKHYGGYDDAPVIGNDQRLAERMIQNKARFSFLPKPVAFNLDHGKS